MQRTQTSSEKSHHGKSALISFAQKPYSLPTMWSHSITQLPAVTEGSDIHTEAIHEAPGLHTPHASHARVCKVVQQVW